ncbi:hypothetical protein [Aquimarina agarivorans]|nr:hypothetical protein [Aquimarina agarivorans]
MSLLVLTSCTDSSEELVQSQAEKSNIEFKAEYIDKDEVQSPDDRGKKKKK